MTDEGNALMMAALAYAERGFHVFPLHAPVAGVCDCRKPDCRNTGKHPRTRNGLNDATTDRAKIESWWRMWPAANIGISCGPSNLAVVDIDTRHGGDESWHDLQSKYPAEWQATPRAITGSGGMHYLYRQPVEPVRNSAGLLGPGIDIRGDGGYIVAPPSLHATGQRYEWEASPFDCEIALYPNPAISHRNGREPIKLGELIAEGERDSTLTSLAGTMRERGMSETAILAAIREENAVRCRPPLADGDLARIARSVARYAPGAYHPAKTGVTEYRHLRKVATDPPSYVLEVSGVDVRLPGASLLQHPLLRKAVYEQADILLPATKSSEWDATLALLTESLETLPAPDDASEGGMAWSSICAYLLASSTDDEEMFPTKPIERDGAIYATGHMLRESLKRDGILLDARKLWDVVRAHHGTPDSIWVKKKTVRAWRIPRAEVDPT